MAAGCWKRLVGWLQAGLQGLDGEGGFKEAWLEDWLGGKLLWCFKRDGGGMLRDFEA